MNALGIIAGHMLGDYLLQNDYQAANKKKSTLACLLHVAIYTTCVCLMAGPAFWNIPVICSVFMPHFVIDRTYFVGWWMRTMRQREFAKPPMMPWSGIMVDQSMHAVCLYLSSLLAGYLQS